MPRSASLIASILAVSKAGAAFLLLDPTHPEARLRELLAAAKPAAMIAASGLDHLAPAGIPVLTLESTGLEIGTAVAEWSTPPRSGESLAYVLYTSGSTGAPKGVMISQGNLANYLHWCVETYCLREGSGALLHTSVAFDLTITSLLAPLACAQRVVLVAEDSGVGALAAVLPGGDHTLLKLTPSHLQALRFLAPPEQLAGCVRTVVSGGEPLLGWMTAELRQNSPSTRIVNEYGPTEATVGCIVHTLTAADGDGPVPIGRPIANTSAYVLDQHQSPAPLGASGELYLGGAGVALGYWGDPELTAGRFSPDPFRPGRMYRTGDQVRYLPSGDLEFLGRADEELKIQGCAHSSGRGGSGDAAASGGPRLRGGCR